MPTISANASSQITIPAGQRLRFLIGGAGIGQLAASNGFDSQYQLGAAEQMIGPFPSDRVFRVTATQALSYQLQAPPFDQFLSNGNSVVSQDANGIQYANGAPVSGAGITYSSTAAVAAAVQVAGVVNIGVGTSSLDETLLLGSNTNLTFQPGTILQSSGTNQHTMMRTGNAEFSAAALPIPGVSIYCADEVTASGTGSLRYTSGTTSLAWQAPGDSSFGAEVDISSVVSAATVGVFIITSSGGSSIYVYVAPAARTTVTRTVRLEPVTGAKAMTWTRASNVRTVTEASHGRRVGDFVINFGPSADVSHGYITAVTANTYTFADTGSDQAVVQTGRAYGVRNIRINGNGAVLNYRKASLTTTLMSNLHAVILNACSDVVVDALEVSNTTKYALLLTGFKNVRVSGFRTFRDDSSVSSGNSDVVHPLGPGQGLTVERARAQGGDNLVGVGCADYYDYVFNCPGYGDLSLIGGRIQDCWGENTNQHPVRFYNANGTNVIRGWTVDGVWGTYSTNADAAVAVIMDTMSGGMVDSGQTNIDSLTVRYAEASRSDGSSSSAFKSSGAGTRRGLKIERLKPRSFSTASSAAVHIEDSTWASAIIEVIGQGSFSGAAVGLFGTGTVTDMQVDASQISWDNSLGGGQRGAIVLLNNANAVITNLRLRATSTDVSASGNKGNWVWINNGTLSRYVATGYSAGASDAILRVTSGSCGDFTASNLEHEGSFIVAADSPVLTISLDNVYHQINASSVISYNVASGGTVRVRARLLRASNRFLRNVAGNTVFLVAAQETEITSTVYQVDAGTPALRLQGPTDLQLDGSAAGFDATATNHAPNASFYNTGAGFGAGVGAYVRGSAAWTRVAA